jgi:exodeoxyribonuclease-1
MASTFYFYDLETSGINPRRDRVMQFAGRRTDMNLKPLGEPDNILIKLTPDILPQPEAILITGITPQQTLSEGITEAEFLKYFFENINKPDTIIIGFNNVRFDDEFMRFMLWRNFYDAYEWQWKEGSSRWDLLDLARMTRALRPDGIKWPFAPDGKPSNRLELIADLNKLEHVNAHDALSDVTASIEVARLIKTKQPKLFDYSLNLRGKQKVSALVNAGQPFIYTSGRYPFEYEKTTVAVRIAHHPERAGALVYDLRVDPGKFTPLSSENLVESWSKWGKDAEYFPVKTLVYNRCPALAPMSVLDDASRERLRIDPEVIAKNFEKLKQAPDFGDKLIRALELMKTQVQPEMVIDPLKVDEQLYDGFVDKADKTKSSVVRAAKPAELASLQLSFDDKRLEALLPLYKARNYPKILSEEESVQWEEFRRAKLMNGADKSALNQYFGKLNELAAREGISDAERYVLEELNLYGQSVSPPD